VIWGGGEGCFSLVLRLSKLHYSQVLGFCQPLEQHSLGTAPKLGLGEHGLDTAFQEAWVPYSLGWGQHQTRSWHSSWPILLVNSF